MDVCAFLGLKMFGQQSVIETFRKIPDYMHQAVDFFLSPVVKKFEKPAYIAWFQ